MEQLQAAFVNKTIVILHIEGKSWEIEVIGTMVYIEKKIQKPIGTSSTCHSRITSRPPTLH